MGFKVIHLQTCSNNPNLHVIAKDFVHGTSPDLKEIGNEYYYELIQRNLIEPNMRYTDHRVCSMHDVVCSFAQYMARNEVLVAKNKEINIADKINSQKFFPVISGNHGIRIR